jgi:hypothetical protein
MFILVKSALRKPPQVQKSWGQPDRSISQSQHQVVQVRSSDHDMKDSLEGSQSKYSTVLHYRRLAGYLQYYTIGG